MRRFMSKTRGRKAQRVGNRLGLHRLSQAETLEARVVLDGSLVITEFLASNDNGLVDEDGDDPDWIEILNTGAETQDLEGWHLTDDATDLNKWEFPAVSLAGGETLVVFASGKNRDVPGANLHTNFRLDVEGGYLALTRPDQTVESEFAPYPIQVENVSYGVPSEIARTNLVGTGAAARVHIPVDGGLDPDPANEIFEGSWIDPNLDDSGAEWFDATTGVGYWDPSTDPNPSPGDGTLLADSVADFSNFQGRDDWRWGYWNKTADADGVYDYLSSDFRAFLWIGLSFITNFNHWDGMKWDLAAGANPPGTEMRPDAARPAGTNNGTEVHHAIRRWTSTITGGVLLHGTLDNPDASGDGVVARILVDGEEIYSREMNGNSVNYKVVAQVQAGSQVDFVIDPGAAGNDVGDDTVFTATIEDVTALVGDGTGEPTLESDIATSIEAEMKNVGTSAYIRVPFTPTETTFDSMTLRMKYQDAFVAYLNGQPIASSNGPDAFGAAWDSVANSERAIADAVQFEAYDVTEAASLLIPGQENVLAIHALNVSPGDDDLLAVPELIGTTLQIDTSDLRYFNSPTPGQANGFGVEEVGPLFRDRGHSPNQPTDSQPIVVTANLAETFDTIANVTLNYRVMYGSTTTMAMLDDGTGADATAGDGIYTAEIPGGIAQPGEMIRWFMTAADASGNQSRYPFFNSSSDTEEYFGTVVLDPTLDSDLPVFHTFLQNPGAADNDTGTKGSLFYNGEFYDRVQFDIHGQSTRGFPKKSYDVDFTRDHRFVLDDDLPVMKDINFLSNYADKAKMRNTLAYGTRALAGEPSHLAFPINVQRNGSFYAVYDFVEDGDDQWLERLGLNPDNSLYKIYNTFFSAGGAEKKAGDSIGNQDLTAFINGLNQTGQALTDYIYDNVDLAGMANYLAGFTLTSNRDCCHKNFYAYRDSHGTGEWSFFPWDADLSYGRNWGGFGLGYHDYTIYPDNALFVGTNNNLIQKLYAIPEFEEMYLRRIRTIMDEIFGPPNGDNTLIEDWIQDLRTQIGADGPTDHTRWGQVSSTNPAQPFRTWEQAVDEILNEYLEPRRDYLYNTLAQDPGGGETGRDPVVVLSGDVGASTAKYFIPGDNNLGTTWTEVGFDDSAWDSGPAGFGYEDSVADYAALIQTTVDPDTTVPGATTFMTRYEFGVDDPSIADTLTLRMKYDDGFVAHINGIEVTRAGVAGTISWNTTASNHPDGDAVNFQNFAIDNTDNRLNLTTTGNVLAIQMVNQAVTSSDMVLVAELVDGSLATGLGVIPLAQPAAATIEVASLDYNPVSGNQDEEYIELVNNNDYAVDISGWELDDAVDLTFRPGTVIPAGESLYVTPDANAFRARATGPSGGQGLFVQGGYGGHLSSFGETIEIRNKAGVVVTTFTYEGSLSPQQEYLRIAELMFNPLGPDADELAVNSAFNNDDFEFVELLNTSDADTLDLNNVRFTGGIEFDFTGSAVTSLAPGARVLVVKDMQAFEARYGTELAGQIAGVITSGSLSNNGETLKLEDPSNATIQEFSYNDDADTGWSIRADGRGSSLQIVDPAGDYGAGTNWAPSTEIHGSPGVAGVAPLDTIVINEVLTNTDLPAVDAIELYNPTGAAQSLMSYYLSDAADSVDSLAKFAVPDQTLAAGDYLVFTETDFNSSAGVDPNDFGLSSLGEQVYLTVGDADGPTHFADFVDFGAVANGESFGRYPEGHGPLVPMSRATIGSDNGGPRVGPIVITEINYNPAEPSAAALAIDPTIERQHLEFIEIHNGTDQPLDMTDWRVRGGIDYDFPDGYMLAAGDTMILLSFNPVNNITRYRAFREHYGLASSPRLAGGYSGQLDDAGGERITLQRPGQPPVEDPLTIPRLIEDEVRYDDEGGWPASADGMGDSLQRRASSFYANTAASWQAAAPSPGQVDFSGNVAGDLNGDGVVTGSDIDYLFDAVNAGHNSAYFDLDSNSVVDAADVTFLVEDVLGTAMGDANLDGGVDARDFNRWNANKFVALNAWWRQGDFNGDGVADAGDFNVWNANKFTVGAPAAADLGRTPQAALAAGTVDSVIRDLMLLRPVDQQPRPDDLQRTSTVEKLPVVPRTVEFAFAPSQRVRRDTVARRAAWRHQEVAGDSEDFESLVDDIFSGLM